MDYEREALEKFRTRWRRWLGQKTRRGEPHWVTLLDSRWASWASTVLDDEFIRWQEATRERVKEYWLRAIGKATMRQLYKLDEIYAGEKMGL